MKISNQELTALYDRYAHVLFRRCRAILGDDQDAYDAVQDTFAKVIVHAADFRQQSSPLTWMYRISTNHCLNALRDRGGRAAKLDQRQGELGPEASAAPGSALDAEKVLALLEGADDETRQCVIHTYFDDCTREEVAALVGLSVPTVRKRVNDFLDEARRRYPASPAETRV